MHSYWIWKCVYEIYTSVISLSKQIPMLGALWGLAAWFALTDLSMYFAANLSLALSQFVHRMDVKTCSSIVWNMNISAEICLVEWKTAEKETDTHIKYSLRNKHADADLTSSGLTESGTRHGFNLRATCITTHVYGKKETGICCMQSATQKVG